MSFLACISVVYIFVKEQCTASKDMLYTYADQSFGQRIVYTHMTDY